MMPPEQDEQAPEETTDRVLSFAHIGDLHLTDAKQRNFSDCDVRALVLGRRPIQGVTCQVDDGERVAMMRDPGGRLWIARLSLPADKVVAVTVQAMDDTGRPGQHTIRAASPAFVPPVRTRNSGDAASVGAWPENGIFGTQLGPNRNGRTSS